MSYDIYGRHLRPGFCEVHPDVAQEYPCSLCLMVSEKKRMKEDEYNKAKEEQERICQLENELTAAKKRAEWAEGRANGLEVERDTLVSCIEHLEKENERLKYLLCTSD